MQMNHRFRDPLARPGDPSGWPVACVFGLLSHGRLRQLRHDSQGVQVELHTPELRQQVLDRLVRVLWVSGDDMLADICTKYIPSNSKFMEIRSFLMNLQYRFTKFYGQR